MRFRELRSTECSGAVYPEVVARKDPGRRSSWFGSYLDTILQRDVRDMAHIEGLTKLPRVLALLAARATGLFNVADIARLADIPNTTLRRYLTLLEMTFLIHLLPAWSTTLRARLVKSPKLMIGDSGLIAHLQGLNKSRLRSQPDSMGPFLETISSSKMRVASSSVRRSKRAATIRSSDFKGLRFLKDSIGSRFRRGVVLYTGGESIPFGEKLEALPVSVVWQRTARRTKSR